MRVVLLCPRRADGGHRDRLWRFARATWVDLLPDWPLYEGHHDRGPFNRSAAVNRAADEAGAWDVAVIIDADVLPDPDGIEAAVTVARTGRPASGFDHRNNLSKAGTEKILRGYRGSWARLVGSVHDKCISGAFAVSRELWDEVGGFDENFRGWGFEDTAFEIACETVSGERLYRHPSTLWHLWHDKSPEHDHRLPGFRANRARREQYTAAAGDRDALDVLLTESRAVRGGVHVATTVRSSTIPRILHRTVPAVTSPEVDRWWQQWGDLHPGWTLMDHRDPLDPDAWETSPLWPKCSSGAQKAGLIRLEALHRWGGVYVDSDVEPYRPLDALLGVEGFAGWEDAKVVPDAVLGARPGHPAVAVMLDAACRAVETGKGAWDSGPGVTTATLPGRADWLLLPPGSLYPYHYSHKARDRRDYRAEQPWAFTAHHWHHSWAGR